MITFFSEPAGIGNAGESGDMPMGPVRLTVMGEATWPSYKVSLVGSLDSETLIAFEIQFDQSTCEQFELVILDVSGLTGLDRAGADALRRFRRHIESGGGSMTVQGTFARSIRDTLVMPPLPGVLD
jgi:ABC-type transporter Mla MlaB component